jgi:Family of unknown function (DUF5670)
LIETLIVVLIVLWLLGFFGSRRGLRVPRTGNLIHILLVIALILIIVRVL